MRPSRSLIKKLCLGLGIVSLLAAVGCGYGGSVTLPHPTGNYSNTSLNGSYVYQVQGTSRQLGPYREIGVFTADKAGHITGGSDDFAAGGVVSNSITGIYSVASDGTGFITISPTALGQITFAITLVSSSKVYLMEADNFADGAGMAELQSSAGTTPSGTFVFRLHQIAATSSQNPLSDVGVFTVSGTSPNSTMDQNLGGSFNSLTSNWTFNPPLTLGRGTGSFIDSTNFTTNFVYYLVDSGKMVFLVSNSGTIGSGSAETQTGAVGNGLSGSYAFGSRGDLGSFFDFVGTVGQFNANGGSISSYVDDSMQLGNYSNASFTGSYTKQSNGRVAVALNGGAIQQVFWVVSPSRAFFLTNDPSKVEDGTADLQLVTTFAPSTIKGQYAMVMDGIDLTPQLLARVGTAQFDGVGKLVITELANASSSGAGAQNPGLLSGTYQISSSGRVVGSLNSSTLNLVIYAVSGSDAYALQIDSGTNTSGTVSLQH